jgi:hypothetical protein
MLMHPKSTRQKYHNGYWLQFYLLRDFMDMALRNKSQSIKEVTIAYFNQDWSALSQDK